MWRVRKSFNNMEDTCTKWLYNEEGMGLSHLCHFVFTEQNTRSFLELRLSAMRKNEVHLRHASGPMKRISLCLWMKVQLIDERHIVEGLGQYVAGKLLEKHFSVVADGKYLPVVFYFLL